MISRDELVDLIKEWNNLPYKEKQGWKKKAREFAGSGPIDEVFSLTGYEYFLLKKSS